MTAPVRENVPHTGRDSIDILSHHALDEYHFAAKTVLDLGCGLSSLGHDLWQAGVETQIIGVDIKSQRHHLAPETPNTSHIIAHLGSPLPIQSASMDVVIATYSFPMWAVDAEQIEVFYDECRRVTKEGGLISVFPNHVTPRGATEVGASVGVMADYYSRETAARLAAGEIYSMPNWLPMSDGHDLFQALKIG